LRLISYGRNITIYNMYNVIMESDNDKLFKLYNNKYIINV